MRVTPAARAGGAARASAFAGAVAFAGVLVCAGAVASAAAESDAERRLVVRAHGCDVALEQRPAEPVLTLRPGCDLGFDQARAALATLLVRLCPAGRPPAAVRAVALGRLERFPAWSERLARAAARDPAWDAARGRPRAGSANAVVARLLDADDAGRALASALETCGLRRARTTVEKVLVAPVRALPYAAALEAAGVPPASRLPFDAQVWWAVEPR